MTLLTRQQAKRSRTGGPPQYTCLGCFARFVHYTSIDNHFRKSIASTICTTGKYKAIDSGEVLIWHGGEMGAAGPSTSDTAVNLA